MLFPIFYFLVFLLLDFYLSIASSDQSYKHSTIINNDTNVILIDWKITFSTNLVS